MTRALLKEDLKSLGGGKLLHLASKITCNTGLDEDTKNLQTEITALLLNNGADPNDSFGDDVPLLEACRQINIGSAKLLLDSGANVNATNSNGNSLQHVVLSVFYDKGKM